MALASASASGQILPGELQSLISSELGSLSKILEAPTTPEEIRWLLKVRGEVCVFYYTECNSCDIKIWKRQVNGSDFSASHNSSIINWFSDRNPIHSPSVDHLAEVKNLVEHLSGKSLNRQDPTKYVSCVWCCNSYNNIYLRCAPVIDLGSTFFLLKRRLGSERKHLVAQEMSRIINSIFEYYSDNDIGVILLEAYLVMSLDLLDIGDEVEIHPIARNPTPNKERCEKYRDALNLVFEKRS